MTRARIAVADGGLWLESLPDHDELIRRWLPRPHPDPSSPLVTVRLGRLPDGERHRLLAHTDKPALTLGPVRAWVDPGTRAVSLAGRFGAGLVNLAAGAAELDPGDSPEEGYAMLTLAAGLLLASVGRVLLHAGAVSRPDGGVLLVAGDTHSGKSTTTLTLARLSGWAWLSDDQVVLASRDDGGVEVFGWARRPHLDTGYLSGESTGQRGDAEMRFLAGLTWSGRGPHTGTLLPRIEPNGRSVGRGASAGAVMEALVRQGAWIMAEPETARSTLGVLQRAAALPARALDLGPDSYARPDRLATLL
ncbi:MAG TPA: hypothetical protein VMG41_13500 [Gemmatimonadales bacterium]|nr:hypothetical protein [Gemmatimonadales bacterium]